MDEVPHKEPTPVKEGRMQIRLRLMLRSIGTLILMGMELIRMFRKKPPE